MPAEPAPKLRRSREEVSEALIDAAEELYAESPASEVTVRNIAALAGVNVAMVNRYFGNKDNLIRAVLERSRNRLSAGAVQRNAHHVRDDAEPLFQALLSEKAFVAVLARACLDGRVPELQSGFRGSRILIDRLKSDMTSHDEPAIDPQIVVACLLSLGLGYSLYGEFVRRETDLAAQPSDTVERGIAEVLRRIVDLASQ